MSDDVKDEKEIEVVYTNWRGETALRRIKPMSLWFGKTQWHPEPQWLVHAFDVEKGELRDFAWKDIGSATLMQERDEARAIVDAARQAHDLISRNNDDLRARLTAAQEALREVCPFISPLVTLEVIAKVNAALPDPQPKEPSP